MSEIKFLKPFTRFCMTIGNLPSSYLVSMTYEEQLLWLCDYLEKTVIPTINNNSEVTKEIQELFNQLKYYVEHYFDNLDVQEEINNKLDEMAQDGTLTNILSNYANIQRIYNTTIDMISDSSNLSIGQKIKTLGYYEKNDGGGAEFLISDTSSNLFFQISFENKFATLLSDKILYLNQMGAKNDASEDCSLLFNKACEILNENWLNKKPLTTLCIGGYYLINETINIPPSIRLINNAYTELISNVHNSSVFHIHYLDNRRPDSKKESRQYTFGEILNFSKDCIFKTNLNKNTDNITALEIGERINLGNEYTIAFTKLKNFAAYSFTNGVLFNNSNLYGITLENLNLLENKNGITFSTENVGYQNSGERICIKDSLIGNGENGLTFNNTIWDIQILNCSIDFTTYPFNINQQKNCDVYMSNSHVENFIKLIKNGPKENMYRFINSIIQDTNDNSKTWFENVESNVFFENCSLKISGKKYQTFTPNSIIDLSKNINFNNCNIFNDGYNVIKAYKNSNFITNFDNIDDGVYDISNSLDGKFIKNYFYGASPSVQIVTDNFLYDGHKSLVITRTLGASTTDNVVSHIYTSEIPISGLKGILYTTLCLYNYQGNYSQLRAIFLDENKKEISSINKLQNFASNNPANEWVINPRPCMFIIPQNARYVKFNIMVPDWNNHIAQEPGTLYKIGLLYANVN